jgi:hypothetical protein
VNFLFKFIKRHPRLVLPRNKAKKWARKLILNGGDLESEISTALIEAFDWGTDFGTKKRDGTHREYRRIVDAAQRKLQDERKSWQDRREEWAQERTRLVNIWRAAKGKQELELKLALKEMECTGK